MKKILAFFIVVIAFTRFNTTSIKAEDIVGKIYSTDILATVNGLPIDSYNIGGKTCIIAEDLYSEDFTYGFFVDYNVEHKLLTIDSFYNVSPMAAYEYQGKHVSRGIPGTVLGDVYATDVKVMFNNQEIRGYNIDGKIAVCIEDLGTLDDSAYGDLGYSKYFANFTWDETTRTVALNSVYCNFTEGCNRLIRRL